MLNPTLNPTLKPTLKQTLKQVFGYDQFRQGQEAVIQNAVNGHSCAAIFPTGSGKSLCYQLTALQLPQLTLVISPLLALMKDQLTFLQQKNIAAATIDSSQDQQQSQAVMAAIRKGQIKILMISVERFKNERFRQFISQIPISLMVIDEAHCISEWGHNFRPDYLKLPQYQQAFNIPQVMLLTATATPKVIADMQAKFNIQPQHVTATGFYRQNLNLWIEGVSEQHKNQALINRLKRLSGAAVVYVTLQQTAEQIAKVLQQQQINATAYHAGMKNEIREQIQQRFMAGEYHCIVATIAFGMGIDKSDIRQVIHYDLPKSIENYSQEIGRAGRDGLASHCTVLANSDKINILENFVYGDCPELSGIQVVLDNIAHAAQQGDQWEVLAIPLSNQANIRQLPLKTLLVYLQLEGIIAPLYAYFAEYRFKLLVDEKTLIGHFSGERQAFVQALLASAAHAKIWYTMDFDKLYQQYGSDRQRVIAALEYFNEQGYITLQSQQMTEVFQIITPQFSVPDLSQKLYQTFASKVETEIARIQQMIQFFQSDHCLSQQLCHYFGDDQLTQPCGHCSVCAGRVSKFPPAPALAPLASNDFKALTETFMQLCPSPATATLISKFLCGIGVPLFSKLKAQQLPGFGRLAHYRFEDVLTLVEQQRG